jgi:hypothetical protein
MWSSKAALGVVLLVACLPASAAEDLRALEVVGQRGQSLEQTRRDRYECHNWAVEQTGETPVGSPRSETPVAAPADDPSKSSKGDRELRRERIDRAIAGAVIGGAIASILGNGRRRHSGDRALAGAAAGAAVGAATARNERAVAAEAGAEEPSDYLRALTACLEGRGYSVALPTAAELTAHR